MIGGLTGWPVANATGPGNPTPTPRTSAAPRPISASSPSNADSSHPSTVSGPSAMAMSRVVWASTCPVVEGQHRGGRAAGRLAVAPRHQEAVGYQGIDALGDGGASQAGQRREVGPGRGLAAPDELQDGAHAPTGRLRGTSRDGAHGGQ